MSDPRWLSDVADVDEGRRALRQALDEAPSFAPSDVRRRRVWAKLARPQARRRVVRRAFWAGAAVASLLTAATFLSADRWSQGHRDRARVARAVAASVASVVVASVVEERPPSVVSRARPDAERPAPAPTQPQPAEEAELLAAGSVIKTDGAQRIARRLQGGARVEIQPLSSLAVDARARPEVRSGQVRFDVPAQANGRTLVVRFASYHVIVAGARFALGIQPTGVRVSVEAGAVEIWAGRGRLARVEAGETWMRPVRARDGHASAASASGTLRAAGLEATGAPRAPSAVSDGADLAAAREARATDPSRAISLYDRIFVRGGPAAENALYQIAVIYHDQLDDPARALAAWERYRASYPRGQLRVETDLSIFDTLAELGEKSRALNEGLAFLRRHPTSERRGEVARVAADLARVRGQCRLAATLYAEVAGTQVSADDADDAAFGRASCLRTIGDPDAEQALAEYLAAHPRGRHAGEARRLVTP